LLARVRNGCRIQERYDPRTRRSARPIAARSDEHARLGTVAPNGRLRFLAKLAMQAGGQPCNFAADRIAMHRAAADRLVQHLGGLLERFARLGLVAARRDSFRRRLGQGAGTCPDDAVTLGALETLPMALLGRWMNWNMRHNQSYLTACERRSNTPVQFIASLPAGGARRSFR